jgi:DNA repair exonuclease SbcCD nuclease subunit
LGESGIDVVAVAGNHDHDTFPRLARSLDHPRLHVLGRGGTWESVTLERNNAPALRFVGWSFPRQHVTTNPLDALDLSSLDAAGSPEDDALPTLGVLHCEAGASDGRYAPVPRPALARAKVDAWLLGHIHAANAHREGGQLQLYPGSLQPLDPGETGSHGAYLVEVAPTGTVTAEQLPLASLCYAGVTVDISGCDTPEAIDQQTFRALQSDLEQRATETPTLEHVVYRLTYEGRTRLHQALDTQGRKMVEDDLAPSFEHTTTSLDAVRFNTQPDHDLAALAESNDPPGVIAQRILSLQNGDADDEATQRLLREAARTSDTVYNASGYAILQRDSATSSTRPPDDTLRNMLIQQGLRLLDRLTAQRSSSA